ncbi:hypothetical protein DFQ30_004951 [Apophysomyces sp. BC1015]|nr:hypothetical protein DFQ30_004951 [Apophysomyces sp. BC1015]
MTCVTSTEDTQAEQLFEDFRTPKKIVFAAVTGGSSHVNWVLSILDELAERGHQDDHIKFGAAYPRINVRPIGPQLVGRDSTVAKLQSKSRPEVLEAMMDIMIPAYKQSFIAKRNIFQELKPDVVICDHMNLPCIDIASAYNIAFIVTQAAAISKDSEAPYVNTQGFRRYEPTTLYESFVTRFNNAFIAPLRIGWHLRKHAIALSKERIEAGATNTDVQIDDGCVDSLKLVNNLFGIDPPRPMGPLVEMVGPIIPREHPPLTEDLRQFLETHHRIDYVAFGQHFSPTLEDTELILAVLLENIELGALDGFIWANPAPKFPPYITTSSNKAYNVAELLEQTNNYGRVISWAPQYAVLRHPTTVMFVTHGGLGSLYEALFAGKRTMVFPIAFDQFSNAIMVEHNHLGRRFKREMSKSEATQALRNVALDSSGDIQANVERYKALVQIHSKRGTERGADLVEEVAFTNKNGKLPHRYEASREMSFVKAHNLDLYFILALIITSPIVLLYRIIQKLLWKSDGYMNNKETLKKML